MNKEIKKRIEKDVDQFIKNNRNNTSLSGQYHWTSYVAGATSEHPKAWNDAIDKCIEIIKRAEGNYLIKEIRSLKL